MMKLVSRLVAVTVGSALAMDCASGQEILAGSKTYFGRSVAAIPDVDGDKQPDYAVGLGLANDQDGEVRVYSSATHKVLFTLTGPGHRRNFGFSRIEPLEDLDGDGIAELCVPISSPTATEVVSLGKRRILFEIEGVHGALITTTDLDRDGHRDLVACNVPALRAFSGSTGKPIDVHLPDSPKDLVPALIAGKSAGTTGIIVTGDGDVKFFDGSVSLEPSESIHYGPGSGKTSTKWTDDYWPAAFAGADFDRDGVLDLIEVRKQSHTSRAEASAIYTLELAVWHSKERSADFVRTWALDNFAPVSMAEVLSLPGDVDGDGVDDIALANPSYFEALREKPEEPRGVLMVSGKNGHELWHFEPLKVKFAFGLRVEIATGTSMRVMGDLDGDGARDLIVGCGDYTETSGMEADGAVLFLSGRTGKLLHRIDESSIH